MNRSEIELLKNTKAIITVALYGLSPDMDPIMSLAREKGIKVIEDNAECFLGEYKAIAEQLGMLVVSASKVQKKTSDQRRGRNNCYKRSRVS